MGRKGKIGVNLRRSLALSFTALFAAVLLTGATLGNGQRSKPVPGTEPPEIERGKAIYAKRCAVCHFAASDVKKVGPGLKGLVKRGEYADGRPVTDDSLREWIERGGKNMPGFKAVLRGEQVRELIAYLKTQ